MYNSFRLEFIPLNYFFFLNNTAPIKVDNEPINPLLTAAPVLGSLLFELFSSFIESFLLALPFAEYNCQLYFKRQGRKFVGRKIRTVKERK